METVKWTKIVKENYRVEVSRYGLRTDKEMESFCYDLNDLFKDHNAWQGATADVNYDEISRCIFCDEVYQSDYDPKRKECVCSNCSKGKLEYSVQILAEAETKSK